MLPAIKMKNKNYLNLEIIERRYKNGKHKRVEKTTFENTIRKI